MNMMQPIFYYCYYSFSVESSKQELRVWVTPSLSLEWKLYIDNVEVGYFLDERTNILIHSELAAALSYDNVVAVYNDLLRGPQLPPSTSPK